MIKSFRHKGLSMLFKEYLVTKPAMTPVIPGNCFGMKFLPG